ncbi:MAG TPA: hypothetical protein VFS00_31540, partial [Polyangiaceae bacterium]|nr:hypothetical protein [Polyangiaceae bacterium]
GQFTPASRAPFGAEGAAGHFSPTDRAPFGAEGAAGHRTPAYHDITEVLTEEGELDAFIALRRRLADDFDQICGDTFCGGDYPDLRPVHLACSASAGRAYVKECVWTFGGSYGAVDGPSGAVRVAASTFACRIPVGAGATAFLATLGESVDPLYEPLPGQDASVADALSGCLRPPAGLPPAAPGPYVDAVDALGDDDYLRFLGVRRALAERFDELCGDTFCEGDYSWIMPLDLRCSVDPGSGEIGGCAWAFAGASSPHVMPESGAVRVRREAFVCPLPVGGPVEAFLSALEGPGDPLNAALPGGTASIYDALIECLLARNPPGRAMASWARARR